MSARALPPREAGSALLLLGLLTGACFVADPATSGGPLALVTGVAIVHASLLSPALAGGVAARWGMLAALLSLPALAACSFGHPVPAAPLWCSLLIVCACLSGCAARAFGGGALAQAYYPSMLLLLLAPFACSYLVAEFGSGGDPAAWRLLSPLEATSQAESGAAPPALALGTLLLWPALAAGLRPRRAP
ncbi:MAG: hypothetical protein ACT4PV_02020 [Planctomycetaceae bacterium]